MLDAIANNFLLAEWAATDVRSWTDLAYLVAAVLFIFGIKGMTHPKTAVRGNLVGALGMLLAVVATLAIKLSSPFLLLLVVLLGIAVGSAMGVYMATKVQMTQMPQLVALFNGFGGIASVLVAGAELIREGQKLAIADQVLLDGVPITPQLIAEAISNLPINPHVAYCAAALTGLIGSVTFTGSMVAAGKLQEMDLFNKPLGLPHSRLASLGLFVLCLFLTVFMALGPYGWPYALLVVAASILGVLLVWPIGGADMPVVIALLNSYSGLAAAAAGFVIGNNVLIIAGSLVGASGLILTSIMCKWPEESDPSLFLFDINVRRRHDASRFLWTIEGKYSQPEPGQPPEQQEPNPEDRPIRYRLEHVTYTEVIDDDKDGMPIVNAAGQEFDEPLESEESRLVLVAEKAFVSALQPELLASDAFQAIINLNLKFAGAINTDNYRALPNVSTVRRWLCHTIGCSDLMTAPNGALYYVATFRLELHNRTWQRRILNRGFKHKKAADDPTLIQATTTIVKEDGTEMKVPTNEPVLLAADGTRLPAGQDGNFITFDVRRENQFGGPNGLGIDP